MRSSRACRSARRPRTCRGTGPAAPALRRPVDRTLPTMGLVDGHADDPPTATAFGLQRSRRDDLASDLADDNLGTSVDVARRDVIEVRIGRGAVAVAPSLTHPPETTSRTDAWSPGVKSRTRITPTSSPGRTGRPDQATHLLPGATGPESAGRSWSSALRTRPRDSRLLSAAAMWCRRMARTSTGRARPRVPGVLTAELSPVSLFRWASAGLF
jgi:hypothetical protein